MKKLLWGAVEDAAQRARQNWEANAPSQAPVAPAPAEKQYLRLPMESARKLRWYDKGDTAAIVKTHLREKREMTETICALKNIIIRSGVTESQVDAEVLAMLQDAETVNESDEGVNSVLLAAAQAELEALKDLVAKVVEERSALKERLARAEHEGAAVKGRSAWTDNFSLEADDDDGGDGRRAQAIDPTLVADLNRCVQTLESALSAAAAAAKHTHAAEANLSAREVASALQAAMSSSTANACDQGGEAASTSDDEGATSGPSAATAALLAKLHRLEAERRNACDEQLELERQLSAALTMAEQAGRLKEAVAQANEQCSSLEDALQKAQMEASAAKSAARAADEAQEAMKGELKRLQHTAQGAGALDQLQDLCLQAEERAHSAERRASVADARCARAESGLREVSAAVREKEKSLAAAQAEVTSLRSKLAVAESQGGGGGSSSALNASHQEAINQLEKQARSFEAEARAAQRDLAAAKADLTGAEGRMQAAEAREAQVMAELHVMDELTAERDQLAAQVFALRERLNEMKSEKGGAEYYKKLAQELQSGRARVEDELLVTGQLVTQLEGRLRAALDRVDAAETAAQVAESRARDAQRQVGAEVEQRLSAACANRSLWPPPILSEVSRMEARLDALQGALSAAQSQMEVDAKALQTERRQQAEMQRKAAQLEEALLRLEEAATERAQESQQNLARVNAQLSDACAEVAHLTAANKELSAAVAEGKRQASRTHSVLLPPSYSNPQLRSQGINGKWQVQNVVGGGSLYGLTDSQQAALGRAGSYGANDDTFSDEAASESLQGSHHHSHADLQQHAGGCASNKLSNTHHVADNGPDSVPSDRNSIFDTGDRAKDLQQQPELLRRTGSSLGSVLGSRTGAKKHQQQVLSGVDILYLKNVVLKFMEAVTAGRVAERDALLPAITTLLQATPAEFHTLQRVLQNTAPPSVQVLSALGIKLPGF